jgi:hypothetical protein
MQVEFIPYEQALELKELGFDKACFGLYAPPCKTVFLHHYGLLSAKEQILAPLYQQAFKWFRDKYNIDGFVRIEPLNEKYGFVIYNREKNNFKEFSADYTSTEEAELECLKKIIEMVKQPKQPKQDEITFGDLRDVDVDSYMQGYNRAVKGQELQHKQPKKD